MDSPLNRAHQQERRAEKFISGKKYMEAVACYEIASAYITEAMKTTTTSQALISMQLQYEDHLRKQKLLRVQMERQTHAKMKLQNCEQTKTTCNHTLEKNEQQDETGSEVLERSGSSFDLSLQSSQGVLVQADDVNFSQDKNVCQSSIEDLQMQVLSLTQALEDTNRENNHLRNIVICFKKVLHEKLGFSEEEIEAMLASQEGEQNNGSLHNIEQQTLLVDQNVTENLQTNEKIEEE